MRNFIDTGGRPNYLSTVIKKTGKPIGTWIAQKTTAEVKAMLQNSGLSVKEITSRLGFAESTHFNDPSWKTLTVCPILKKDGPPLRLSVLGYVIHAQN